MSTWSFGQITLTSIVGGVLGFVANAAYDYHMLDERAKRDEETKIVAQVEVMTFPAPTTAAEAKALLARLHHHQQFSKYAANQHLWAAWIASYTTVLASLEAAETAKVQQKSAEEHKARGEAAEKLAEVQGDVADRGAAAALARRAVNPISGLIPQAIIMPTVVGMLMQDADFVLRRAGLTKRGARAELNFKVPAQTVLSQTPSAGESIRLDTMVTLVFANVWNQPAPIGPISSDEEARQVCPGACDKLKGEWTGKWFADTRGGGDPRFNCGCAIGPLPGR